MVLRPALPALQPSRMRARLRVDIVGVDQKTPRQRACVFAYLLAWLRAAKPIQPDAPEPIDFRQ